MSETVIKVENLSKQYRIGAREGYRTFRETLVDAAKAPLQGLSKVFSRRSAVGGRSSGDDTIWALKDVSFEVKQGEVVGIIGRNGAGKSTLLKILSRITEPTEGRVELRGRVGSLLEIGTGFHPELTGHENIYLYGAILGMDRWEVTRKFDEIVAFAELEKFIDTPVKKYSSGMYMRLAFAVAAHLEPEILLVDEVLAVGDAAFQKKCLGKMGEVSREGRTVLFVSHNMQAITQLCLRALLVEGGLLATDGAATEVCERYLRDVPTPLDKPALQALIAQLPSDKDFRLIDVEVNQNGTSGFQVLNGKPVQVKITYEVFSTLSGFQVFIDLCDDALILLRSFHDDGYVVIPTTLAGTYCSTVILPGDLLAPHDYTLIVHAGIHNVRSCTGEGLPLRLFVHRSGRVASAYTNTVIRSKLAPFLEWKTVSLSLPRNR